MHPIKKRGLMIAIGFVIGLAAHTFSTAQVTNMIALHNRSSRQYNRNCTNCHGQVLTEQSLDPARHTAHVTMRSYVPGENNNEKCRFCHRSVDLVERSAGNVRRQVDVTLCALCHGPARSAKHFYQSGPSPTQPDGQALYTLVCSGCHGALSQSEVRGESASEIQEEISDNEGGMGPLRFLTTLEIQAIARALAE